MARKKTTELLIRVKGTFPFPIDMLRYDAGIPASEQDSNKITHTHGEHSGPVEVEVRVTGNGAPHVGRWESFGWTITGVFDDHAWRGYHDGFDRVFK